MNVTKQKKIETPPVTPEARTNKLVNLALDQVEEELIAKRATSQTLQHFLKLANTRAEVELEKLRLENQLLEAKIESEQSANRVEEMIGDVLDALKSYSITMQDDIYD
jgi:hypothetical protein